MKEKFTKLFGALLLVALMLGLVLPFQTAAAQDIPGTVSFTVAADDGVSLVQVNLTITDTTPAGPITYYNVYRSFTESGVRTALANNLAYAGAVTAFADTTAIAGTVYWYWVEACDAVSCTGMIGNDGWRAVTGLPVAPGTITATAGAFYDRIEVTIVPPGGFALPVVGGYYKIQRQRQTPTLETTWTTVGSITTLLLKDTSAPGQPATLTGVQPTYFYRVDVCGPNKCNADNAAPVALNVTAGAGSLNTVANPILTATAGDKKVGLTWTSVLGAMNYYGQRAWGSLLQPATPLVFAPANNPEVLGTLYLKDDPTVVAGNTYVYYVWACYNATNCSQKVPAGPIGPNPVVTVPADFKVSKGDESTAPAAGVDVFFTAKPDPGFIYTYELNRSDDSAGLVNVLTTPLVGALLPTPGAPYLLNDNGVNPGQSYYFWVKVCDTSTPPPFSCATTSKLEGWGKVPPIAAATTLFVSDTTGVSATWNALAVPNVYYKGWRNTSNSFSGALGPKNIFGTGGPTIAGKDTTGTVSVTYWYFLQACVGSRCSAPIVGTGMKMP